MKFVDIHNTMMAMINPQVNFSSRSPVFFTPIILLAEEPPNWLDSPPPLEFCANITNTSNKLNKIINPITSAYITLFLQCFNLSRKVSLFLWKLPNQLLQYFDRFIFFSLFQKNFNKRFRNDVVTKFPSFYGTEVAW